MATLAGQRAQFTWSLNQYNLAEDAETRAKFAKRMAKYIAAAPANGFTIDDVTQGQIYPASEVEQYIRNPGADDEDPGMTEEQASSRPRPSPGQALNAALCCFLFMPTSHVLWTGLPLAYPAVQKSG